MTTSRVLAIVLVLLAGLETAAAKDNAWPLHPPDVFTVAPLAHSADLASRPKVTVPQYGERTAQQSGQPVIPPSVALRLALSYSPGSQGLGVDLVEGRRLMYAVKLKTGNRVHRVLVDARTGQILGE